jgi:hypothetical protein
MKLRSRRRHLVVFSSSVARADRYGAPPSVRTSRNGRVRRSIRLAALLTVISLMSVVRVARSRRRLLTGLALAAFAVILRDSLWGLVFFMAFLLYLPPWSPQVA